MSTSVGRSFYSFTDLVSGEWMVWIRRRSGFRQPFGLTQNAGLLSSSCRRCLFNIITGQIQT